MNLAPIVLFVYKRPEHTKKTIEALQNNFLAKESELIVFSDAAKNELEENEINNVRQYLKNINGFKKVTIIEQDKNLGLADSIIFGVTEIVNKHGKIIVLEDDIVTSPYFLKFMNDALSLYENDNQVMHISGYFFPIKNSLPPTFFFNQTSCWGWGTWKRSWKHFSNDTENLYQTIIDNNLIKKFNLDGTNNNFEQQLRDNINGKKKTWAIKWQASVFLSNGLCLHPNISLVENIGFDGSGENCSANNYYNTKNINKEFPISKAPLFENSNARKIVKKYYKKILPSKYKIYLRKLLLFIKKYEK